MDYNATGPIEERKLKATDFNPQWHVNRTNLDPNYDPYSSKERNNKIMMTILQSAPEDREYHASLLLPVLTPTYLPEVVTKTRGRPPKKAKGHGENSTRRDPSGFELVCNSKTPKQSKTSQSTRRNKCSVCGVLGHNRTTCPTLKEKNVNEQRNNRASDSDLVNNDLIVEDNDIAIEVGNLEDEEGDIWKSWEECNNQLHGRYGYGDSIESTTSKKMIQADLDRLERTLKDPQVLDDDKMLMTEFWESKLMGVLRSHARSS